MMGKTPRKKGTPKKPGIMIIITEKVQLSPKAVNILWF